ncbi:MAG: hypothetical protein HZC05_04100 [Candidatus Magasanikbacteria bacterium]|nr:hypothetical protein [Candidatus Magasanikbacteria bacterium]
MPMPKAYLANTIEKSICNADNVGCRAYAVSSTLDKDNKWQWDLNKKIYFNAKATQCDYSNEGCSQFARTGFGLNGGSAVDGEKVNLKKAPEYYNCYGENLITSANPPPADKFSSSTVKWAVNKADLSKIFDTWKPQNKEQCGRFAQVCSYEEVGCEKYTPTNGDLPIPGILTANDQCPDDCVGYETFIQQATNFEKASASSTYFIPSTAKFCQESEAGCDEFVNLEAQTAGGEGKEYYTELRQCSQIETDGAVYYTWEGSDTAGYQLRSFNLKKAADNAPVSTVALNDNTATPDDFTCGINSYKDKKANADCREFYNKDGIKFYRLYTKTITVSATDCKKLRKTVSDQASCTSTGGTWDSTGKNICVYLAIPKEGQSCKASAVGCRAYKGNAGNNFQIIKSEYFEYGDDGAVGKNAESLTGWIGKFSAESTVVGGKSLKVDKNTKITTSLAKGTTYSISFWAKGLGNGLAVSVKPTDANEVAIPAAGAGITFSTLALHADWQNYTIGPVVIDWDESVASSTLRFDNVDDKVFYLDNIVIKQINEKVYVVKDSWKTPSACDNLLGDEYGQSQGGSFINPYRLVPQAMLGCQKYTDRQNQEVAVKSFTSMCREEAVGCEEFTDMENTGSPFASFSNLKCVLTTKNASDKAVECKDKNDKDLCSVAPGSSDCKFNFVDEKNDFTSVWAGKWDDFITFTLSKPVKNIEFDEAIFTPADSKEYLVNDKNNYCSADQLGCAALGPIDYSSLNNAQAQGTAYLKNQPDIYGKILCEKAAEGCEEFKTTQGAAYFKDPAINNLFCEYSAALNTPGWVMKDIGKCDFSNGAYKECSTDADCGGSIKCINKNELSCDSNNNYKIPANGDTDYYGAVGLCPAEQNGCSEFIDPKDTSALHPDGTPYFVLNNSKLDRATCGNQASVQEGCILFNETSKGVLNWNAARTYIKSEDNKNAKVNPVDCGSTGEKTNADNSYCLDLDKDQNNANTILKVQRDRVCGEWLACKSSMSVRDDNVTGGWKEMCTELSPCLEANSQATTLTGKCGQWVDDNSEILTVKKYQDRFKSTTWSWEVPEYSGYTLPEAYQISALSVAGKNLANQTPTPPNAAKEIFTNKGAVAESCRGYAQADTPDGMCSYTKVTYSAQNNEPITQYFPYNQLLGAEGVCSGGFDELGNSKKGFACVHSGNCSDDRSLVNPAEAAFAIKEHGTCLLQKQISKSRGWEGYCLDPAALNSAANVIANPEVAKQSQSKNCTLWYPLTTPSGSVSSDHLYASAGYIPPSGSGKYWCVQAKGNANLTNGAHYLYKLFKDDPRFFPPTDDDYNENTLAFDNGTCQVAKIQKTDAFGKPLGDPYCPTLKEAFGTIITNSEIINQVPSGTKIHLSEIVALGLAPTKTYDDNWPGEEVLIFRDQHMADIKDIQPNKQDSDGRYWSGLVKAIGQKWAMDAVWVEDKNQPKEISYERLDKSFCKTFKAGKEASLMAFRAIFDKDGMLTELRSKICDDGSNRSGMRMDLNIYLTEVCTGVRQVVDNGDNTKDSPMGFLAKGRTDRLWQASQYALGKDLVNDPKLDLKYNQMFAPFGSFGRMQDPIAKTISEYATSTVNTVKLNQVHQAGLWPIWMAPGGATPLNCEGVNGGDCGNIGLCADGPNKDMVCDTKNKNENNGCEEKVDDGVCVANNLDKQGQKICSGVTAGKDLSDSNIVCADANNNQKSLDCPKPNFGYGQCQNGSCQNFSKISCSNNNDCIVTASSVTCDFIPVTWICDGGIKDKQTCVNDKDCKGGTTHYECLTQNNIRGLCVGGKNHGLACGSSLDCPSKKYSDSADETVEYGVCVGSSLDDGKNIPQSGPPKAGEASAGKWRLLELFVQSFGDWSWIEDDNKYEKGSGGNWQDKSDGFPAPTGTTGWASAAPKPPVISNITVNDSNGASSVIGSGSTLNAVLRFNAYADNDQMPIVRMAVDWGDGSKPYVIQGWFKNRKEKCNEKKNLEDGMGSKIHFGDSSDACEEGFYQFTHIYECVSGGAGWDAVFSSCKFTPKVQVLDNWGWCNGTCKTNDVSGGCWQGEGENTCDKDKSQPWTPFSGQIIITPALFIFSRKKKTISKSSRVSKNKDIGLKLLRQLRWPMGKIDCIECGNKKILKIGHGRVAQRYFCPKCYAHFSDTSRTIFDKTRTPIISWLQAAFLIDKDTSISSRHLMLETGIGYKSVWRIKKFLLKNKEDSLLLRLKILFESEVNHQ